MMPGPSRDMARQRTPRERRGAGVRAAARRPGPRVLLYDTLAQELRRRVTDGVYAPGTAIPSEAELVSEFVFPLLARHGIIVGRTELRFEGGAVSEEHAALLGLPARAPLILVHYTLLTPTGAPILTGVTTARSDRFAFTLTLPGERGGRPRRPPSAG